MRTSVTAIFCSALLAVLSASPAWSQEVVVEDDLSMDRSLGEISRARLAAGTAATGVSRLAPDASPAIPQTVFLGVIALALGGLLAGIALGRRSAGPTATPTAAPGLVPQAPVPRTVVSATPPPERQPLELTAREEILGERETSLEEREIELAAREAELGRIADKADAAIAERDALRREVQALRLRSGPADDDAQTTIDSLRAEIERLEGADAGLDETGDAHDEGDADLHSRFEQQKAHIRQLEDLLSLARDENESVSRQATAGAERVEELTASLAHRNDELAETRGELERLREQSVPQSDESRQAERLDADLTELREERDALLGETAHFKSVVPELERRLAMHAEEVAALESERDAACRERDEQTQSSQALADRTTALQEAVAAAEAQVAALEAELATAREQIDTLRSETTAEDLARENAALSSQLEETDGHLREARSQLEDQAQQRESVNEWRSTVESLQAEVRRKTTLIDSQADRLADQSEQIGQLRDELSALRSSLEEQESETESLRGLLAGAANVVVSLQDEIGHQEHEDTRLRLALNPREDPFSNHVDAVDPVEADIEALRFTVRSRRDLAKSLRTILADEHATLEQARRRVARHDEMLVSLKHDISVNRLTMRELQTRLEECGSDSETPPESSDSQKELRDSVRLLEALRSDLDRWRGRVKPLHEALLIRNERIAHLEAELQALRESRGIDTSSAEPPPDGVAEDVATLLDRNREGESAESERSRYLDEMKQEWERIVSLETELAGAGTRLARLLELDETRCRQIESLELARSAQMARIEELRGELAVFGVETDAAGDARDNVVNLKARRPS